MIRNITRVYEHPTHEPSKIRPGIVRKSGALRNLQFKTEVDGLTIGEPLRVGDRTIKVVRDEKNKPRIVEIGENGVEVPPPQYKFSRPLKLKEARLRGMLVLTRHKDESIIIGDNIVITVVDIRGDKVRLGINASVEIPVHRQEIYEAIQRENKQAAQNDPNAAGKAAGQEPPKK